MLGHLPSGAAGRAALDLIVRRPLESPEFCHVIADVGAGHPMSNCSMYVPVIQTLSPGSINGFTVESELASVIGR